jgi:Zn-dependent protease
LPVWPEWALQTLFIAIYLNTILAFFNLLPIPPLDGSKIVTSFLPTRWSYLLQQIEPWGFIILLVLLNCLGLGTFLGKLSDIIVRWLIMW